MCKSKLVLLFMLLVLLLIVGLSAALAQEPPPGDSTVAPELPPPQPLWWATTHPYRWEEVDGHYLAVWSGIYCHNQHYVPGDWQTCFSGYGCIDSWTWWLKYPESKLGVPSHWRDYWPLSDAKNLNNYIATCWYY